MAEKASFVKFDMSKASKEVAAAWEKREDATKAFEAAFRKQYEKKYGKIEDGRMLKISYNYGVAYAVVDEKSDKVDSF